MNLDATVRLLIEFQNDFTSVGTGLPVLCGRFPASDQRSLPRWRHLLVFA